MSRRENMVKMPGTLPGQIRFGIRGVVGFVAFLVFIGARNGLSQTSLLNIHARAAMVIDAQTGKVVWSKNPDLPLPPASTTKILTALVQVESLPPDAPITISPEAASLPGTGLQLKAGQRFSSSDLLAAELLESDNRAAAAVAETMGPDAKTRMARLNDAAKRHGAKNVHFSNPTGLDAPDHSCTARDLAFLARDAMRNPEFAHVAGLRTSPILANETHPAFQANNRNQLLDDAGNGVDGVKTGWTQKAGYCFVGSAVRGGKRLITVVLNSPDWQGETLALLNFGFGQGRDPSRKDAPTATGRRANEGLPSVEPVTGKPKDSSIGTSDDNSHRSVWPLAMFGLAGILAAILALQLPRVASRLRNSRKEPELSEKPVELTSVPELSHSAGVPSLISVASAAIFVMPAPFLKRKDSRAWTLELLDDEVRLPDAHLRNAARRCAETHADALQEALLAKIVSPRSWVKFGAADLLSWRSPAKAEKSLLDLLDDDSISPALRDQASAQLVSVGQDRHEDFWLSRLIRETDPFAARGLTASYSLEERTQKDLRRSFDAAPPIGGQAQMMRCLLASVLAVHGGATEDEARTEMASLAPDQRNALINQLRHPSLSRRVDRMLDGWMESEPDASDAEIKPELILPALQIASLRMGFGHYPPEMISDMLRRASGGEVSPMTLEYPELEPLAKSYASDEVRAAVSHLLADENALGEAVQHLAESGEGQSELAFWLDKIPSEFQNSVARSLADSESRGTLEQLALLEDSPSAAVRRLADRAQKRLAEMGEIEAVELDRAA